MISITMNKAITTCFIFLLMVPLYLKAQPDTVIVYTIDQQNIDTILPVTFNTTGTFDKTSFSTGTLGNVVALSTTAPTTNLFSGSNFCDIAKAASTFSLNSYPARTAVALRYWRGDSLKTGCSGIMVSPSFVLTAGHCIFNYGSGSFSQFDSLKLTPAYNNATEQPGIPSSMAKRVYIFKTYYDRKMWDDIALIELKEPIGLQTGWVGISYDANQANYLSKVFHKFSYPAKPDPNNPLRVFNGDTLYYNYGNINITSPFLGINSPAATGISGQSGSSFLYTDNTDYYSVGVFNFSNGYNHYKITNHVFYQLENILQNNPMSIQQKNTAATGISIYPNPFQNILCIESIQQKEITIEIINPLGQVVSSMQSISQKVSIPTENLETGIYFIQATVNGEVFVAGKYIKE